MTTRASGVSLALIAARPYAQQVDPVIDWIRSHACTAENTRGGSREFFQLKHRMLEFLAGEMGFSIFSIEANPPEAYRLNDYVLEGKGDPAQLLRGMYLWTWDTEEVLAMIQWMREFNRSGKGRVQFTGFASGTFPASRAAGKKLRYSRIRDARQLPAGPSRLARGSVARFEDRIATTSLFRDGR